MSSRFDDKNEPFLVYCDIYHFYGSKPKDFFSVWVMDKRVVKVPARHEILLNRKIEEVLVEMQQKGYQHEIV